MPGWMLGRRAVVSSPPVKFTPASSRAAPDSHSSTACRLSRAAVAVEQPHGRLRRVGEHQPEAATRRLQFSAVVFDFSAAVHEAPLAGELVRTLAAHRECGKLHTRAESLALVCPDIPRPRTPRSAPFTRARPHLSAPQISSRAASASSTPSRPNFRAGFAST